MANLVATTITGDLTVDTDTLYVDSTNNEVGIGESSPDTKLHVKDNLASTGVGTSSNPIVIIQNERLNTGASSAVLRFDTNEVSGTEQNPRASIGAELEGDSSNIDGRLLFATTDTSGNMTERMRIDSSGVVNVGTTTPVSGATALSADGISGFQNQGNYAISINRQTNDGALINFQRGGDDRGFIGIGDSDLYIGKTDGGTDCFLRFGFSNSQIIPASSSGAINDNTLDLGALTSRFDDIYATNGTIQTSDQNEKQSIQSLTASEMAVAQRISKLFKTFKWNSAVEEKGDSARTHTGIIAQDVQQAFVDEGLDASNYALFISSTWWEKEISVDAVAPQEAVYETQTDEEGNEIQVLVQEAVEGKDAYTYMDIKNEETEGYTEKTRLGIRYPELLSFVSSAFEQRLTNIETRLTALEA